jgi:hypothetical protein
VLALDLHPGAARQEAELPVEMFNRHIASVSLMIQ